VSGADFADAARRLLSSSPPSEGEFISFPSFLLPVSSLSPSPRPFRPHLVCRRTHLSFHFPPHIPLVLAIRLYFARDYARSPQFAAINRDRGWCPFLNARGRLVLVDGWFSAERARVAPAGWK